MSETGNSSRPTLFFSNNSIGGIHMPISKQCVPVSSEVSYSQLVFYTGFQHPHSSTLAWKISWMEEPGRLQSMGLQRVGHDWATSRSLFTFMHWRRKWQPTHVLAWRIPGTGEPGGLPSLGSHRVGHDWSDWAAAASIWHWDWPAVANGGNTVFSIAFHSLSHCSILLLVFAGINSQINYVTLTSEFALWNSN